MLYLSPSQLVDTKSNITPPSNLTENKTFILYILNIPIYQTSSFPSCVTKNNAYPYFS